MEELKNNESLETKVEELRLRFRDSRKFNQNFKYSLEILCDILEEINKGVEEITDKVGITMG